MVLFKVIGEIPSLETTGRGSEFPRAYLCSFVISHINEEGKNHDVNQKLVVLSPRGYPDAIH